MRKEWKRAMVVFFSFLLVVATAIPALAKPALSTGVIPHQTVQLTPTRQFLQQWADWYTSSTSSYSHEIQIYLSTNSGLTNVVSYAAGVLTYNPNTGIFETKASQYFNDRLWSDPPNGNFIAGQNPFSPSKTDQIKVEIDKNNGQATITLLSWGNAKLTFNLQCENQLLYANSNTGDKNWQNITISCKKFQTDIPR